MQEEGQEYYSQEYEDLPEEAPRVKENLVLADGARRPVVADAVRFKQINRQAAN